MIILCYNDYVWIVSVVKGGKHRGGELICFLTSKTTEK